MISTTIKGDIELGGTFTREEGEVLQICPSPKGVGRRMGNKVNIT